MKKYLITDPKYYPRFHSSNAIARAYRRFRPDFLCLRDKKARNYALIAKRFLFLAKRFKAKLILHNRRRLAKKLNASGVHLSADRKSEIKLAARSRLITIASCHSAIEARNALKNGASYAALSPIFAALNKGAPKGAEFLNDLDPTIRKKTIALGGITSDREVSALEKTGVFAFASIRYFTRKHNGI
ncbi:MAG: thiamine phosphate synthase [Helicobacteraceae bacterium]|jgi:thiamine-phosphate pyrophosphorylase|nr:thiamine phosphate synthase [Helicobacteraceae bacterium]